jgi:hypothetical protein
LDKSKAFKVGLFDSWSPSFAAFRMVVDFGFLDAFGLKG